MPLNQMSEHFNDAFELYFPQQGLFERTAYRAANFLLLNALRARRRIFRGELLVNERIVEYPLVFRWLKDRGRVLDIGCVSSRLPIQLASLGYEAHGLDTRPYRFSHPNFTFHQSDLFRWTPADRYDSIVLVSVIEHFGFGGYGDLVLPDADKEAVSRIATWLKEDGQLLISVPFGRAAVGTRFRVYDAARLRDVFGRFAWAREGYFVRKAGGWVPSDPAELATLPSPRLPVNGVAILDLRLN